MTGHAARAGVRVTPLLAAEVSAPALFAYGVRGAAGRGVRMPFLAFLVEPEGHGPILVDTGLHPDAVASVPADFGLLGQSIMRGVRPVKPAFDEQLRSAGVSPDEVKTVVMTHLHVDHTSGMRLLPNAEFVTTKAEWEAAHGRGAELNGYRAQHLPARERMRLLDLSEGEVLDLLGDESVHLLATPGHTPGHLSVALRTERGPVLLAGDSVYTERSLRERRLPLLSADRGAQARSLSLLERWISENPGGRIVPTHDPQAWQRL